MGLVRAFLFDPATVTRLWLAPGVLRTWAEFRVESALAVQDLHPEFARFALDDGPPTVTNSALAIKALGVWAVEYGHWWKHPRLLNDTTIALVLHALGQVEEVGRTYWSSKTGFAPALGALGMVRPRYQMGLTVCRR